MKSNMNTEHSCRWCGQPTDIKAEIGIEKAFLTDGYLRVADIYLCPQCHPVCGSVLVIKNNSAYLQEGIS
jgi:hypothetical protein